MPNAPTKTRRPVTPEGQAAAGRIAEFRQNVNNGATAPQARATVNQITNPVTPAPVPTASTISATSLAPATPMKLATPVPATQAQGMMAEFTDGVDTYTQNLADQAKALEAPKTNALNDYITQLTTAKGVSGLTNDAYAIKGGVNDITPELNDINDKIRREQLSLRRRTEAINNNGGGLASGAQSEISNIERDSFAKQADLSIIQQAVQGRFDSAKEIADRAVTAQLEKQTNDLAILKFNYEENRDLFSKADQRAFESAQADRERKLEAERENKKSIYDLGIQASADGAPASVVQKMLSAKTREEALALGGSYIGALDRQAKQANIAQSYASIASSNTNRLLALAEAGDKTAIGKLGFDPRSVEVEVDPVTKRQLETSLSSSDNLLRLANEYKTIIDDQGITNRAFGSSETLGKINSLRALMTAEYKKAETLGTLDAGVLALMSQIVGEEPTSGLLPFNQNIQGRRSSKLSSQIGTFIENITTSQARDKARLGIAPTVDFTVLGQDDNAEIDSAFGITNTSTPATFNPAGYF